MNQLKLKWPEFKAFVDARSISIQYVEHADRYQMWAFDGPLGFFCRVRNDGEHPDCVDFETNYKDVTTNRMGPFPPDTSYYLRGVGVSGTITAGQTQDIDYKLTEDRKFNKLSIILKDHAFGDKADLQVVDKDNILGYGAGVVLSTFFSDFYFSADVQDQGTMISEYPGTLLKDLYLRIKYYSTGGSNVQVKANLYLHKFS